MQILGKIFIFLFFYINREWQAYIFGVLKLKQIWGTPLQPASIDSRIQLLKCKLWIDSGELKIFGGFSIQGNFEIWPITGEFWGHMKLGIRAYFKENISSFNQFAYDLIILKWPYFNNKHFFFVGKKKKIFFLKKKFLIKKKKKLLQGPLWD